MADKTLSKEEFAVSADPLEAILASVKDEDIRDLLTLVDKLLAEQKQKEQLIFAPADKRLIIQKSIEEAELEENNILSKDKPKEEVEKRKLIYCGKSIEDAALAMVSHLNGTAIAWDMAEAGASRQEIVDAMEQLGVDVDVDKCMRDTGKRIDSNADKEPDEPGSVLKEEE